MVTVTGMDDEWLQIASWGKRYFIRRCEYMEYIRKNSSYFASNILHIF
jgi:hypothetical protein